MNSVTENKSAISSDAEAHTAMVLQSDGRYSRLWIEGLWTDNPALVKLLGLCPLLAVSNNAINALALGIATTLTLLVTNAAVSLLRNVIRPSIRLPVYVLIIASTVTALELLMQALLPALHATLGIFLPLIVTNCLIIGRAEAFGSRHTVPEGCIDALAMGIGFSWVLVLLGGIREIVGQGTLLANAHFLFGETASTWKLTLLQQDHTVLIALLPPGAFLILGLMLALKNLIGLSTSKRQ